LLLRDFGTLFHWTVELLHPLTHLRSVSRHFSLIRYNRTVARASVLWRDINWLIDWLIDWDDDRNFYFNVSALVTWTLCWYYVDIAARLPLWKLARSNWNCNSTCRMVSLLIDYFRTKVTKIIALETKLRYRRHLANVYIYKMCVACLYCALVHSVSIAEKESLLWKL